MVKQLSHLGAAFAALLLAGQAWAQPERPPSPPAQAAAPAQPATPEAEPDPELTAPLKPLDQFDVEAQAAAAPAPPTPPEIRYTVKVDGLGPIGLFARFRSLSTLYKSRGRAETMPQLRARADEDVKLAERLMRSEGYYDGRVDAAISPSDPAGQPVSVSLTATPGDRYRLGEVRVTGPDTRPPGLPRAALTLQPGQWLVAPDVEAAEANVSLRLPEQGYPFVKVGQRDVALDPAAHTADYALPVTPGVRGSFGDIRIGGAPVFDAGHVKVISRFKPGQLYDSRMVDDLRRALVATSLYASVGVEPVDSGRPGPDGTNVVDLLVTGQRAKTRNLSGAVGYDTGLGVTLEGAWTDRDFVRPEGALTLHAIAGTQQQLFGVTFVRSNFGQRDRTWQVGAQISSEQLNAYRANAVTLSTRLSRASTPIWQKRWTYSAGAEVSVSDEEGYDLSLRRRVRRTYEIVSLPLQLGYDRSDSLLDPSRGYRVTFQPSPELSIGDGTHPYFKAVLEGTTYVPAGRSVVLAGRLRFSSLYGAGSQDIAPTRRFYAGGGGSVRGFGYQELGPKDPDSKPIGGASATEFSAEARYRFGNFGVVGFIDGGQVYQSSTPGFDDLRFGAGVGGRFYTNFGPLRFDVATPLSRRRGESVVALYISIGQAF